ncbi:MAG: TMEM175 family protein [Bacteroidota bacterium]|nr:TMEM175 family protein [Bacteroidota bacterium]
MNKTRLEAFSDGVIAIIITIMVLELKPPHGSDWQLLRDLVPKFISYIISFIYVAIYWNNHHHLLHTVKHVTGAILWSNTHLLFWISLMPFVTAWAGENHFAALPVAAYSFILLMAAIAYFILSKTIISVHGKGSLLSTAIGNDLKGIVSMIGYATAVPLAFYYREGSIAIIAAIAVLWLVPDRRIEKKVNENE